MILAFTFICKHLLIAEDRLGRTTYGLELFVLQVASGLLGKRILNCREKNVTGKSNKK